MRNAWRLFVGDLKRLRSNVITGIIVLGLILCGCPQLRFADRHGSTSSLSRNYNTSV